MKSELEVSDDLIDDFKSAIPKKARPIIKEIIVRLPLPFAGIFDWSVN